MSTKSIAFNGLTLNKLFKPAKKVIKDPFPSTSNQPKPFNPTSKHRQRQRTNIILLKEQFRQLSIVWNFLEL